MFLCSHPIAPKSEEPQELSGGQYAPAAAGDPLTGAGDSNTASRAAEQVLANNPLAAGSLVQLIAPVRLRQFRSAYHVRAGNELRLVCLGQRGYPAALMSWYVGNQLVDAEFLSAHADEFRLIQLQTPAGGGGLSSSSGSSYAASMMDVPPLPASSSDISGEPLDRRYVVEVNPIPSGRLQAHLQASGQVRAGQWVEYRDLAAASERVPIETADQQLRYLRQKLHQLTSAGYWAGQQAGRAPAPDPANQASISILVIKSLDVGRHMSRFACRATTRANTDEVTTIIRVIGKYSPDCTIDWTVGRLRFRTHQSILRRHFLMDRRRFRLADPTPAGRGGDD